MVDNFKAMLVTEYEKEGYKTSIVDRQLEDLPEGDLLIEVKYSSLNYKDALSSIGNKGVTKKYPHTPGIDAAGIVVKSDGERFEVGDKVIVTGFDLGMNTWGGFSQYIRIPEGWAVDLPKNLTIKESMAYGTAGFTGALSVYKLIESGVKPEDGEILVTGSTGGVGSTAISILSKLGFEVIGATGKASKRDKLLKLGCKEVIDRSQLEGANTKAMLSGKWAGVVDTLGGSILSNAIKSTKYGGSVTCCGNITSGELETSIYPFILRGVSLLGIDSVNASIDMRNKIWKNLSKNWKSDKLWRNIEEVTLRELPSEIEKMLEGKGVGRKIINLEK